MLFGFSQTFGPRRLSVRQFCDYLGQREIFGIVDVDPLDAGYDGDVSLEMEDLTMPMLEGHLTSLRVLKEALVL